MKAKPVPHSRGGIDGSPERVVAEFTDRHTPRCASFRGMSGKEIWKHVDTLAATSKIEQRVIDLEQRIGELHRHFRLQYIYLQMRLLSEFADSIVLLLLPRPETNVYTFNQPADIFTLFILIHTIPSGDPKI